MIAVSRRRGSFSLSADSASSHTHRDALTDKGRQILPAILAANRITLGQLQQVPS